jgi:hypothetical protein
VLDKVLAEPILSSKDASPKAGGQAAGGLGLAKATSGRPGVFFRRCRRAGCCRACGCDVTSSVSCPASDQPCLLWSLRRASHSKRRGLLHRSGLEAHSQGPKTRSRSDIVSTTDGRSSD